MSTRIEITCTCGQAIHRRDVLQHGRFLRLFSPSFMYIKFRCSRCKRTNERFITHEQWEAETNRATDEVTPAQAERLADLGTISLEEMQEFRRRLDGFTLSELLTDLD